MEAIQIKLNFRFLKEKIRPEHVESIFKDGVKAEDIIPRLRLDPEFRRECETLAEKMFVHVVKVFRRENIETSRDVEGKFKEFLKLLTAVVLNEIDIYAEAFANMFKEALSRKTEPVTTITTKIYWVQEKKQKTSDGTLKTYYRPVVKFPFPRIVLDKLGINVKGEHIRVIINVYGDGSFVGYIPKEEIKRVLAEHIPIINEVVKRKEMGE